eukprot:819828_1
MLRSLPSNWLSGDQLKLRNIFNKIIVDNKNKGKVLLVKSGKAALIKADWVETKDRPPIYKEHYERCFDLIKNGSFILYGRTDGFADVKARFYRNWERALDYDEAIHDKAPVPFTRMLMYFTQAVDFDKFQEILDQKNSQRWNTYDSQVMIQAESLDDWNDIQMMASMEEADDVEEIAMDEHVRNLSLTQSSVYDEEIGDKEEDDKAEDHTHSDDDPQQKEDDDVNEDDENEDDENKKKKPKQKQISFDIGVKKKKPQQTDDQKLNDSEAAAITDAIVSVDYFLSKRDPLAKWTTVNAENWYSSAFDALNVLLDLQRKQQSEGRLEIPWEGQPSDNAADPILWCSIQTFAV